MRDSQQKLRCHQNYLHDIGRGAGPSPPPPESLVKDERMHGSSDMGRTHCKLYIANKLQYIKD